ncbi:MAG: D-alanine--D-alanine ligase family protein [Candidatus Sumerlaeia bacterium]|nr:D-alanine--D-alanine ligase family protein [Candidatus Sumerlaeia bacterium]
MSASVFPRRVALFCGGPSSEYVVSLTSARCVAHALDRYRYRIRVFCIREDGLWVAPEEEWGADTPPSRIEKLFDLLDMPEHCPTGYFKMRSAAEGIARLTAWSPAIVLPIMHGAWGEDGRMQGLLDILDLPFVGSGVLASALAMDKRRTLDYLAAQGIRTARHILMKASSPRLLREDQIAAAGTLLGWPIVVKPSRGGSSVATAIVRTQDELYRAVTRAFDADTEVVVEQFIAGREVTCAVLDLAEAFGGRIVCPPTEIRPKSAEFFTFDAKYTPGASEEVTPARMPDDILARIQVLAEKAHDLLGCAGLSRSDMIVPEDGQPVYLETNTLPGMTSTSLLPQGAAAVGISMTSLLTGLIEGKFEGLIEKRAREEAE